MLSSWGFDDNLKAVSHSEFFGTLGQFGILPPYEVAKDILLMATHIYLPIPEVISN